jgi:hypothetical protein
VDLRWGYTPNSYDRTIADEWAAACSCRSVHDIEIGEHAVSVTARRPVDGRPVTVKLKRQWDLAADLSEAVSALQPQLE